MHIAIKVLIALIAIFHLYIAWFEMFAWESRGPKVFRNFPRDLFPKTKALAANQGLYNAFLVAGLVWSLIIREAQWSTSVATFFLACVAVAGMYGSMTADKKILYVQAVPAIIALVLLYTI